MAYPSSDTQFLAEILRRAVDTAAIRPRMSDADRPRLDELAERGHSSEPVRVDGQLAYEGTPNE